jgi:nucleoside-diphosphate-sugar epimerase
VVSTEQKFEGVRVLVTGASGFIGARLAERLGALGAEVHGTSRGSELPEGVFASRLRGDLADEGFVRRLVAESRPEVVFHLASEVTGARDPAAVLPTLRANLASTVHLLLAVQEAGCRRLVLAGSMEEPEAGSPGETPPAPSSPYAAAKLGAGAYARMFHALWGTPVVTARVFMVYGPGQRDLAKLVPYVTLSLLRGERPALSSGARPVDWVYVDDVVEGLLALAVAPGVEGLRLDLGSGELVTVRAVAERLAALARSASPAAELGLGERPDRPFEQVRRADVEETRELTGWRPRVDLSEGLRRTWEHYREALRSGRLPG